MHVTAASTTLTLRLTRGRTRRSAEQLRGLARGPEKAPPLTTGSGRLQAESSVRQSANGEGSAPSRSAHSGIYKRNVWIAGAASFRLRDAYWQAVGHQAKTSNKRGVFCRCFRLAGAITVTLDAARNLLRRQVTRLPLTWPSVFQLDLLGEMPKHFPNRPTQKDRVGVPGGRKTARSQKIHLHRLFRGDFQKLGALHCDALHCTSAAMSDASTCSAQIAFRLPQELREEVERAADAERRTPASLLRVMIEEGLERRSNRPGACVEAVVE